MEELKLEHEIFYGSSEFEIENQIHWFLDKPWISYQGEETYRENDRSYATVVHYYFLPSVAQSENK